MGPRRHGRATSHVGSVAPDRDDRCLAKLTGQVRDWKVKCVCGGNHTTCNNGWMRSIEDRARPALIPLILGRSAMVSTADQAIIATWAVLKVMVAEFDRNGHMTTHWTHRQWMRNHQSVPRGWGVWIGHFQRTHWRPEWISSTFLIQSRRVLARYGLRSPTFYNGSAVTQVIGNLFIHVIHFPMPNRLIGKWHFPPTNGTIFRIWPATPFFLRWPHTALSDSDADSIANAVSQFIDDVYQRSGT